MSKQAAGVSKNTLEDLTYVGKSTLGDLTKTAKEAATKKGIIKIEEHGSAASSNAPAMPNSQLATQKQVQQSGCGGPGNNFFSSIGTDFNGLASTTTTMFSGMFGKSKSGIDVAAFQFPAHVAFTHRKPTEAGGGAAQALQYGRR